MKTHPRTTERHLPHMWAHVAGDAQITASQYKWMLHRHLNPARQANTRLIFPRKGLVDLSSGLSLNLQINKVSLSVDGHLSA